MECSILLQIPYGFVCVYKYIYITVFYNGFFFIHPEEDRQVGQNVGVLYKRVLSSFVFYILLHEENI